jgi:TolC family type I secretion outer membrane protein
MMSALILISGTDNAVSQDTASTNILTLEQMLRQVYLNNPLLKASQAELRATHELYPQALAGWRPTILAESSIYNSDAETDPHSHSGGATTKDITLGVEQPLFRGGKTMAETSRAQSLVKAAYARLLQTEQDIFLQSATAYLDVIRDQTLAQLSVNNESRLNEELNATRNRLDIGDVTNTDLQQAQARLARARAESIAAHGNLESSRAAFEQVAGFTPAETLVFPAWHFEFPPTLDEIIARAEQENFEIRVAKDRREAALDDIDNARGDLLPQVSAFASYNRQFDPQPGQLDEAQTQTLGVRARLAIYEAGLIRSRVSGAKNTATQREHEITQARRSVREGIVRNWQTLTAAQAEITARTAEADATRLARDGVREEARLGERTVIDVLDADQEVLDAEAAVVHARRNAYVASFSLAASLGMLQPERMGMADIAYYAGPHYFATADKIINMEAE